MWLEKSINSRIGTKKLAFCSGWNGLKNYFISKYTKYVFKIQRRSSFTYHNPTPTTPFEINLPYLCIIKSQFSHANGDVRFPCVKRPLFCYPATNKVQVRWFSMNIILLGNKYTVTLFICYLNFVFTIFPADSTRSWSIDSWASSAPWQRWH